jgi:hypothetical protein
MPNAADFLITLSFNKNGEGRVTLAFTLGVAAVDKRLNRESGSYDLINTATPYGARRNAPVTG